MKRYLRGFGALAGGFALSFVGLGVLWIGTPWHYQALMFFPFLLLAFAVSRTGPAGDNTFMLTIWGAAPIGALITMFRDKDDSHLGPVLIVCAWLAGTLSGHYLAARLRRRTVAGT